jgi:8-oxo-dGTP pyrophosphatase MutT (NUDIX family)
VKRRVRAIITENNRILLIHRRKTTGEYFVFPGGSVEGDETDEAALTRECKEELGVEVEVDRPFASYQLSDTQIEHYFQTRIIGGVLGTGDGPEFQPNRGYSGEYALEWVPLGRLGSYNILPATIAKKAAGLAV